MVLATTSLYVLIISLVEAPHAESAPWALEKNSVRAPRAKFQGEERLDVWLPLVLEIFCYCESAGEA